MINHTKEVYTYQTTKMDKYIITEQNNNENDLIYYNQNIEEPAKLFDVAFMSQELRNCFIKEIEIIIQVLENILHTPPFPILFSRIWICNQKTKIPKINNTFYEGFGINL